MPLPITVPRLGWSMDEGTFVGWLKKDGEKVKVGEFPTLRHVLDQAIKAGVKLTVCEQSCMLLGISRGEFIPEAKIVGAATLNDMALDADAVLCF